LPLDESISFGRIKPFHHTLFFAQLRCSSAVGIASSRKGRWRGWTAPRLPNREDCSRRFPRGRGTSVPANAGVCCHKIWSPSRWEMMMAGFVALDSF
jgi:uncharacterized protein YgiB involved in biofilm formation